jgi:hypothetical protein
MPDDFAVRANPNFGYKRRKNIGCKFGKNVDLNQTTKRDRNEDSCTFRLLDHETNNRIPILNSGVHYESSLRFSGCRWPLHYRWKRTEPAITGTNASNGDGFKASNEYTC